MSKRYFVVVGVILGLLFLAWVIGFSNAIYEGIQAKEKPHLEVRHDC